ncbi:MAG: integrase arm-type DNA-binding domain-containing protein [Hyphomicrobiaceae bacterium]|nr:integrase arm-type DNA-binding domain-containing protein [Hyphomicrobiaceae bacterium]
MARAMHKLTARGVQTAAKTGRHSDGGGLYLVVDAKASDEGAKHLGKRWVFIYRRKRDGRQSEMGLGGLASVSLADARNLAAEARKHLAAGRDPIDERRSTEAAQRQPASTRTFGAVADALRAAKSPEWRNAKHRAQWRMTLDVYAGPLREKAVDEITTEDVLAVLMPIWSTKPETASRTRARIEAVLDAARARGLIAAGTANPARWRGHLDHLLPKRGKLSHGHHAALPWEDLPAFMLELRERPAIAARALEWCILTAARLGEALGTRWREIDLSAAVWECPAERMKACKPHRVPLSPAAIAVLARVPAGGPDDLVFPGAKRGKPFSNMVMKALFKRMGRDGITTHGFRSTFRDWAGEATPHPREVCEAALAHAVGDAVEQAYRRGDALAKRRALMTDWAAYCGSAAGGNVVPLRTATGGRADG